MDTCTCAQTTPKTVNISQLLLFRSVRRYNDIEEEFPVSSTVAFKFVNNRISLGGPVKYIKFGCRCSHGAKGAAKESVGKEVLYCRSAVSLITIQV